MKPRDDLAAMQDAARDLVRLERYERQAWSRLKKAIRGFINIKLNASLTRAPAQISGSPFCGYLGLIVQKGRTLTNSTKSSSKSISRLGGFSVAESP